jgi:molecular chaperone GrpE
VTTREEILRRFEQWLDVTLTPEVPPAGIPAEILSGEAEGDREEPPVDLRAMWAAMIALTQEVKLQGRAFKQLSETVAGEKEIRGQKEMMDGLLDLRERLLRGMQSAGPVELPQPTFWDRVFPDRWQRMRQATDLAQALQEGYRLTLLSLDDLLERLRLQPMRCEGMPFDPRLMNAVDAEESDEVPEGTVLSVYRDGYEWNGKLYRPAQVRVAQRRRGVAVNE